jgi:DNA-binding IclR family transcriptional regulator
VRVPGRTPTTGTGRLNLKRHSHQYLRLSQSGYTFHIVNDVASERGSQAVHRVLRVLLCWSTGEPTRSLTEISQDAGLTLPTAHRMIKALQREGFLSVDSVSGRYSLGPTVMDLARVVLQRADEDELVVVSMPHLERMRAITGETVGLHLPIAESRICVAELVSRAPIRTATGVGRTYKLPAGAAGRVLTAWSPERMALAMAIKGGEGMTPEGRREATRTAGEIRETGYAISEGETIEGARAIAFPLFDSNADVRAAVNITGPTGRWTRAKMLRFLPELQAEVAEIAIQLGYRSAKPEPERVKGRRAAKTSA